MMGNRIGSWWLPLAAACLLALVYANAEFLVLNETLPLALVKLGRRVEAMSTALLLLPAALLMIVAYRPHGRLSAIFAACLSVLLMASLVLGGVLKGVGIDSMREALAAESGDVRRFMRDLWVVAPFTPRELMALAAYGLALSVLCRMLQASSRRAAMATAAALLGGGALVPLVMPNSREVFSNTGLAHYKQRLLPPIAADSVQTRGEGPNVIVVMGESTPRAAFFAALESTAGASVTSPPRGLTVTFSNVVAAHTHTFPSLYRALTISSDPNGDRFRSEAELMRPSVVRVLKAAGARVEWFSSQSPRGTEEWIEQLFGSDADLRVGNDEMLARDDLRTRVFDHEMIERFTRSSEVFAHPNQVAFLHTFAGHWDYCEAIPESWRAQAALPWRPTLPAKAVFGDMLLLSQSSHLRHIACHHAAVRYVADNVRRVLQRSDASSMPIVVLYFSDHGEDPYDGSGHDSSRSTVRQLQVPALLHFNDAARQRYPELAAGALAQRDRPGTLDLLSDTLLELRGLSAGRRPSHALTSNTAALPRFSLLRVSASGRRSVVAIDRDDAARPQDIRLAGPESLRRQRWLAELPPELEGRICAHRNNSLLKLQEAAMLFRCLEFDVVIDAPRGVVNIHHPPKEASGLTLADALAMTGVAGKRLWLDVKNLDIENVGFLAAELIRLVPPAARPDVLVETGATDPGLAPELRRLVAEGFRVSYYLPTDPANRCRSREATSQCELEARRVAGVFARLPFTDLSFDRPSFEFAVSLTLPRKIDLNTWNLEVEPGGSGEWPVMDRVQRYIVPYRSPFDA